MGVLSVENLDFTIDGVKYEPFDFYGNQYYQSIIKKKIANTYNKKLLENENKILMELILHTGLYKMIL